MSSASADTRDELGYSALKSELGSSYPTGAGVAVAQIEANNGMGYFATDQSNPSTGIFAGKTFTFVTATGSPAVSISAHATTVGDGFYGNSSSLAPGVTNITAYSYEGWREKILKINTSLQPALVPARVSNHSYLESIGVVQKFDWMTATDDLINVDAVANSFNQDSLGLPALFNGISVGRTDGAHLTGTDPFTGPYANVRTAPLLVVPQNLTSYAAPYVAGEAAALIGYANSTPSLSNGSYTSPRSGQRIYNASTSEVIKAALLAGADRSAIGSYTVNTSNGLNSTFGAGQANIYSSYKILAGREQNSTEAGRAGNISQYGFDYDSSFNQSKSASYTFTTDLTKNGIAASLVWNLKIAGGTSSNFDSTATLYRFNLLLYDQSNLTTPVAQSVSTTENTQNLFVKNLASRKTYVLKVVPQSGQGNFTWDYGLAWRLTPDDDLIKTYNKGAYTLLSGDDNGDGKVDTLDVNRLVTKFGFTGTIWDDGDFNFDGKIDTRDFNALAANFGFVSAPLPQISAASAAAAVGGAGTVLPEPGLIGLAALAGILLRRAQRR